MTTMLSRAIVERTAVKPDRTWSDASLVRECLCGNEDAWSALIDKYKRLIYSVPIKYHATPEDAADIFQAVCLELFEELPRLRKVDSLRSWLITVAAHQCFHWKNKHRRTLAIEGTDLDEQHQGAEAPVCATMVEDLEREQIIREAVAGLPARCREMIHLLFYKDPPLPYRELAGRLGLATGSIGFIRGRCLKRLQKLLENTGL